MKKLIILILLFFNLIPNLKEGKMTFEGPTTACAQFSDEFDPNADSFEVIPEDKLGSFLSYLEDSGFNVGEPFNITLHVNGVDYEGTMISIYNGDTNIFGVFTPAETSDLFPDENTYYTIGPEEQPDNPEWEWDWEELDYEDFEVPDGYDNWESFWEDFWEDYSDDEGSNTQNPPGGGCPVMKVKGSTVILEGTTDPNWCSPSSSIVGNYIIVDSETSIGYNSQAIYNFFRTNSHLLEEVLAGEFTNSGIIPPYLLPPTIFNTADFVQEALILKRKYPQYDDALIAFLAAANVLSGQVHFMLDIVGMAPVIGEAADIANGAIYYLEGNRIDAALSIGSAIPVWGWVSTAGKWSKQAITAASSVNTAGKIAYKAIKTSSRSVRMVRVAVGDFAYSALNTIKAVKPADQTLTNISRSLVDLQGQRFVPTETAVKNKLDDIVLNNDATGLKTEELSDLLFSREGFVKFDAKIGNNNGFDGVYIKKDGAGNVLEIIINEAKQIGSAGNIKLNGANPQTNLKAQMSDEWIDGVLLRMKQQGGDLDTLADVIGANKGKITKTVTGVDKAAEEIVVLKLANY